MYLPRSSQPVNKGFVNGISGSEGGCQMGIEIEPDSSWILTGKSYSYRSSNQAPRAGLSRISRFYFSYQEEVLSPFRTLQGLARYYLNWDIAALSTQGHGISVTYLSRATPIDNDFDQEDVQVYQTLRLNFPKGDVAVKTIRSFTRGSDCAWLRNSTSNSLRISIYVLADVLWLSICRSLLDMM